MPGNSAHSPCPKGDRWSPSKKHCVKKTRKAVKKPKVPGHTMKVKKHKKKAVKSTPKSTPKYTPSPIYKAKTPSPSPFVIPYLSKIKGKLDNYEIRYFKNLLGNITNHLPMGKTKLTFMLDDILPLIQEDIKSIRDKHESKPDLEFGTTERKDEFSFGNAEIRGVVLKQLNEYVKYFKKVADSEGQVDIDDIQRLVR